MAESSDSGHARTLERTRDNAAASTAFPEADELRRRLTQRQLTMLAIGGAIGVGLFLGSSVTIRLAGPGVIVTYLIGALILFANWLRVSEERVNESEIARDAERIREEHVEGEPWS